MIETLTIITLCLIYLIFFRPGKTPPLENPLVIERAGKYHITFAPQLNLAQGFIEEVAARVDQDLGDSDTHYFTVRDKQIRAHGAEYYLLALTRRNGMLYFQAIGPGSGAASEQLPLIRKFAEDALGKVQGDYPSQIIDNGDLAAAVSAAAKARGIEVCPLQ